MGRLKRVFSGKPAGNAGSGAEGLHEGRVREDGSATPVGASAEAASRGASDSWVLVARLVRPHGRRGELIADILTDFPERFHERRRLFLLAPEGAGSPREIAVENAWFQRERVVLKFEGIDSIDDAEGLRGVEVAIPLAERAPLEEGSVYISDLVGCRVYDLNCGGAEIGEIVDVDRETSSTELLIIRRPGGRGSAAEVLVPFVRDYLAGMDIGARRLEMRLPEGLLEINAPMTAEEKKEVSESGDPNASAG